MLNISNILNINIVNYTNMYQSGSLDIRYGPMFASKTKWLNDNLTTYANKGLKVAKIVHPNDSGRNDSNFNDESGSTHHSKYKTLSDDVVIISINDLENFNIETLENFNVIGVDEAQFFDKVFDFVRKLVEEKHKIVLVTGLDADSNRTKWGDILDLIPLSDSAKKLTATCEICLNDLKKANFKGNIASINAPFSKRIVESTERVLVGSKEYIPVCRYHYLNGIW
jgi:thymidine kinase